MHTALFEHSGYAEQDPELASYSGERVEIVRCTTCDFGQPEALPAIRDYFDRMYDQRWSTEWMAEEFGSGYKDLIFHSVLAGLEQRAQSPRSLLDLGAHVGRLIHVAAKRGWSAEGVELNSATAAFAERQTGLTVHRMNARDLATEGRSYSAVTLIDVLEHIPEPVAMLQTARALVRPDGWIAVKVPHGRVQLLKEKVRSRLRPGYEAVIGSNLIHVNQFGPRSLRVALERAGFTDVHLEIAAPELPSTGGRRIPRVLGNALRQAVWRAGTLVPGTLESPLSLHLLAYARNPNAAAPVFAVAS